MSLTTISTRSSLACMVLTPFFVPSSMAATGHSRLALRAAVRLGLAQAAVVPPGPGGRPARVIDGGGDGIQHAGIVAAAVEVTQLLIQQVGIAVVEIGRPLDAESEQHSG